MPTKTTAEPWRAVHRAADTHAARFAGPFIASVESLRDRLTLGMLERTVVAGTLSRELSDAIDNVRIAKAEPAEDATRVYAEILTLGADVAAGGLPTGALVGMFNVTNPQVLRAARELTADLIRGVGFETKMAVRRIIFESIRDGVPPREAAKLIRQIVGLTARQALAVDRLRKGVFEATGDILLAERRGARYAEKLLKNRALTIASTETMLAANRGQQLAWTEARNQGLVEPGMRQRWMVTPDDRLCARCAPMNGKVVQLGYLFRETEVGVLPSQRKPAARPANVKSPPLHPRCRCVLIAVIEDVDSLPEPVAAPSQPTAADVPEGVFDALMPKRGGWTTQTRKKTIDAIKQAWPGGDGRILADTLSGFQRNGSIPRLRSAIADHLSGKGNDRGRVVVSALRGVDPSRVPQKLHRGMVVKGSPDEVLEQFFQPGKRFDHNISSYSTDSKLAQSFADPKASTVSVRGQNLSRVTIELEGDKRALPIENLAPTNVFAGEKEWVTAGRFEVVDSKVVKKKLYRWEKNKWVATGETEDFVTVKIRQVAL